MEQGAQSTLVDFKINIAASISQALGVRAEKGYTCHAVGLRSFAAPSAQKADKVKESAKVIGSFKQYREADGLFYFKLAEGSETLLTSAGFENGRDAGMTVGKLKAQGLSDTTGVTLSEGVTLERVNAVLAAMRAADEEKKKAKASQQ